MMEKNDLFQIKRCIESSVGAKVRLFSDKGKKKSCVREGIIENSYPSIFTVRIENEFETTRRISFSYTDVLTKAVELVICKDTNKKSQVI
ncbi:MAG: Veg family protein [Oscillospiraceae bacterium]|nr:Veg family protein [Oscillospiraceae bacterium]